MTRPMCIVVDVPEAPARERFQVYLGDCVYPGRHLTSHEHESDADLACVLLAMHYGTRALPLNWSAPSTPILPQRNSR